MSQGVECYSCLPKTAWPPTSTSAHLSTLWISAYDIYPVDSVNEKLRLLNNAVVDNRILITPHDTDTLAFTIRKVSDYYKLKNEIAIRLCKI